MPDKYLQFETDELLAKYDSVSDLRHSPRVLVLDLVRQNNFNTFNAILYEKVRFTS